MPSFTWTTLTVSTVLLLSLNFSWAATTTSSPENAYRLGQREFHKMNFQTALTAFEKFLGHKGDKTEKNERLFWTIDQIGYIFLRVNKNPDGAIAFFKKYENDPRLNEAQQDTISGWISASNDWKKELVQPSKIRDPNRLYTLGKKYFDKGLSKKSFLMDDAGNADFAISEIYLRPFVINHDADPRIGEVLVMMGRVKQNLKNDIDYWPEIHYLKEAIRRFPHSKLAETAWKSLDEDVRFGYTGSAGENLPNSISEMLARYERMAKPTNPKLKKSR